MNDRTIGQLANGRNNNLDLIRFIAAAMVIYSHSFPLGSGDNSREIIFLLSNGKWDAGALAVAIFFVISGFLITQSYERSRNLSNYFKARFFRIFPGLAAVLLFSVFVIGPSFTNLTLKQYFSHPQTYEYLKSFLLFPLKWNLPGVFESNVYKGAVNGALWTIPFEVICYLIVVFFGIIGFLRYKKIVLLLFFVCFYYHLFSSNISLGVTYIFGLEIKKMIELFCYFFAGMLIYLYRSYIPLTKSIAMICMVVLGFALLFGGVKEYFVFFGSYLIFYFGYNQKINLSSFSKNGDFSYGLYIYAFPVQQSVTYLFGGQMTAEYNFIISFVVTLILAVLSWHLIEKYALKLKKVSLIKSDVSEKLSTKLLSKYYLYLDKIIKINWPAFSVAFIIFFVSIIYYNQKPNIITFPYKKNNTIFQGSWLPQIPTEAYRWIDKNATITLVRPEHAKVLVVEGFVPEGFNEVNQLRIFINEQQLLEIEVKPGQPITVNSGLPTGGGQLQIRFQFNDAHKPKSSEPDQREMSALINKIELK
ncbi:Peptidoglycan/LPS O-acetylase OafA/YrhL, contains acyltransferase and SGNH-hydrolase domains [Paenibacillus tianmuensis]|uniref:Peptidoglycan/LPS O-acetylase OafA/YrhL, contains acyltransferase and SGNH-hydrolase domains n=1 Tax=Paenibacillus tianmuensis TaxID=624147 RepID=A0A1G4TVK8_9BACL|nr:acyltransferase [Paenibacillus tianmuensis]SCW85391.1 Peptidoglycan/LPS O-acetylase OafA/YrhL, contains acyltransferase and SGNH-hydrolase domains [Paenibacillus tianmuensis]